MDSVYEIKKKETTLIYLTDHGIKNGKGPYFRDVNKDLDEVIVKKGSVLSKKKYLNNAAWMFHKGEYTSTVNEEEF